ncbi:hypothetical protein [Rhodoferax sp. BLA1]|uniref:hypothetical protein n=1 Tax=Rhodoferax sp. BLA1 TaxID=2576062 RepID=UPI0015D2B1A6|nr:hypothetical protein [Rhodoferax sp. BLA1]
MLNEQDISHALDKQVPDMKVHGFIIGTRYGALGIPSGRLADMVADHLTRILQAELLRLVRAAQQAKRQEAGHVL